MSLDEVRRVSATESSNPSTGTGAAMPTVGAASARASGGGPATQVEDREDGDGLELSEDLEDLEDVEDPEPQAPQVPEDELYMDVDGDGLVSDQERALFEEEDDAPVADDAPADEAAPVDDAAPAAQAPQQAASGRPASYKGPTVRNPNAPAGFLWKPVSDSDGNLAILLPPGMTGKVAAVRVLSPDGQVLEEGRHGGVGNGGREHFRFKRPGGGFPPNCQVQILMKDGSQQTIPIPNPGVRNEGG